ncbi:hypothetical protein Cob_v009134 [Colletotrichum orbiculare MAFF 240422]|uniref:Uncharacterized protein n=1 Tax=Colletotrichum orbiculare (strain 104-T / ATCC 96160 / CBS 514.97 / LARS 414 / MAFF 240422) TaxID=1213857 RepID=A0A484FKC8_COLOR|nr:hypothetical protein Cob_v009134 [Colletotrichum orbiculare MAFF 240422]
MAFDAAEAAPLIPSHLEMFLSLAVIMRFASSTFSSQSSSFLHLPHSISFPAAVVLHAPPPSLLTPLPLSKVS